MGQNVFAGWDFTSLVFVSSWIIQCYTQEKVVKSCRRWILAYLLTYLLTLRTRVLLEKLTGSQLNKKVPAFYGTRFITALTIARHPSLFWARSFQSMPLNATSWRSILILSFHLFLGLPSGSFLRFPHLNPVHVSPLPHTYHMPRPSHSSRFYHPNIIGWAVQIIKLLIM